VTIYLDNNATTPLDPAVLEEMQRVAREAFGNPGSRHPAGRRARQVLEESREEIAGMLDAAPEEVVFTSGGTESTNLALFGLATEPAGVILLPPGEHPATEESVKALEQRGWRRDGDSPGPVGTDWTG
jgi:cysteine desulfurase